jgi:hypothetical protein
MHTREDTGNPAVHTHLHKETRKRRNYKTVPGILCAANHRSPPIFEAAGATTGRTRCPAALWLAGGEAYVFVAHRPGADPETIARMKICKLRSPQPMRTFVLGLRRRDGARSGAGVGDCEVVQEQVPVAVGLGGSGGAWRLYPFLRLYSILNSSKHVSLFCLRWPTSCLLPPAVIREREGPQVLNQSEHKAQLSTDLVFSLYGGLDRWTGSNG